MISNFSNWLFSIVVIYVLSIANAAPSNTSSPRCRCLSSQPCFPSPSALANFSSKLTYPLFPIHPPSYPCHAAGYNASQCSVVAANFYDSRWRSDQPGACENGLLEYSLDLIEQCPFSLDGNGIVPDAIMESVCMQGRVPTIGVNATSVSDIQETATFAREWNLKLVIHNTG